MYKWQLKRIFFLLLPTVLLFSCKTPGEVEDITGFYVNKQSGEYVEFLGHGVLRYDIAADALPTDINKKPPYTGRYKFTKDGELEVSPISVHLGLFKIGFSEDKDQVFITHRFSGRQSILKKDDQ